MRLILQRQRVYVKEHCSRCKDVTHHRIELVEYSAVYHEVIFLYYCEHCFHELKEKCLMTEKCMSVEDWLILYLLDDELTN